MSGRGAERILSLVEWMATRHVPVALAEAAQALELPKSSTLLLLRILVSARYAERGSDGRYRLIRLPGEATPGNEAWGTILRVAEPLLRDASNAVQETGCVAILTDDRRVRYLNKILPRREIRYDRDISMLRIPHHVASGTVLLGSLSAEDFDAYLEPFTDTAPDAPDNPRSIREAVAQAGRDGYFVNLKGLIEGAAGVAAPIRDADGRTIAAVNLSGPRERIVSNLDRIIAAVVEAAGRASDDLARRDPSRKQASGRKKTQ